MRKKHRNFVQRQVWLTSFQKAGYGYYSEYLKSEEFRERRNNYRLHYPRRYFCYICDCKGFLDWHHENYDSIPRELPSHMVWLCNRDCKCGRKCHSRVHYDEEGEKIPIKPWHLAERKRQLRKEFVRHYYIYPWRWKAFISATVMRVFLQRLPF